MHPHCDEFARLKQGAGWDNARAARELGLHPTVIWKYMTGKTAPSLTVLRLLSGITSQPLTLEGEGPVRFHDGPRWLEEWESDAVTVLRRVEPGARRRVINALREIIEATAPESRYRRTGSPKLAPAADPIPSGKELLTAISAGLGGATGQPPGAATSGPPAPRASAPRGQPQDDPPTSDLRGKRSSPIRQKRRSPE